jgi:hypothetical protein
LAAHHQLQQGQQQAQQQRRRQGEAADQPRPAEHHPLAPSPPPGAGAQHQLADSFEADYVMVSNSQLGRSPAGSSGGRGSHTAARRERRQPRARAHREVPDRRHRLLHGALAEGAHVGGGGDAFDDEVAALGLA